ncbi:MAG: ABC transporter permease subunit [Anaerolineae bacterium]|nr:ABC transporter permease subunit [Anaerolineae bacterium]
MRNVPALTVVLCLVVAWLVAGCARNAFPPQAPEALAATSARETPASVQPAPAVTPTDGAATAEHGAPSASSGLVRYVIAGDDWGYPSPFAFYNRGPGYLRMSYLFDTLVWKDRNGFVPWLAERWEESDDGMTWTFWLRQDAKWHDGVPLTAEDVAFTFLYFREKKAAGMVKWAWPVEKVLEARAVDSGRAVVVHMREPVAGLLTDLFGSLPIIPKHIWESVVDPVTKLDREAVIGSSLFRLQDYSKEEGRYVYRSNPDFFLGKPLVDELVFVKVKDPALALLTGEVDEASFSGKGISSVRELAKRPELKVIEGTSDWALKLYFNTMRPPLDQRSVRQAIAHAIDRQEIVERAQMGGATVGSLGLISPGTYWYNPNLPAYPYDVVRARELLRMVEVAFAYPGIGLAIYEACVGRDYPLLQGAFLVTTVSVMLANLLADVLCRVLDPRLRRTG